MSSHSAPSKRYAAHVAASFGGLVTELNAFSLVYEANRFKPHFSDSTGA